MWKPVSDRSLVMLNLSLISSFISDSIEGAKEGSGQSEDDELERPTNDLEESDVDESSDDAHESSDDSEDEETALARSS